MLLIFASTVSLILASLNVYYRDVRLASGFIIQLWFFATPVVYSIDKLPLKLKLIAFLNPMTFIVENIRRCLVEGKGVVWWQYVVMIVFVIALFQLSYKIFLIMEKRFADVI
jgi:ABC-type polysaccharide/polyol phosphate export permease